MENNNQLNNNTDSSNIFADLISFIRYSFNYIFLRIRQTVIFSIAFFYLMVSFFIQIKEGTVRRMFWGRSSFYKTFFQVSIGVVTLLLGLGGSLDKLNFINIDNNSIAFASESTGYTDVLTQAGLTRTFVPSGPIRNNSIDKIEYIVAPGDTLSSIAAKYNISIDTIKWANNLNSDNLRVGQQLDIFRHNGFIHLVEDGDTLEEIADKFSASSQVIAEINWLEPPFVLSEGMELFIPDGTKPAPKVSGGGNTVASVPYTPPQPVIQPTASGDGLATGSFIKPTVAGCGLVTQWASAWHMALDIAQGGGCVVVASDGGYVSSARWTNGGGGFCVEIDHQNGWVSGYCHGNGTFYVTEGQAVSRGQAIMYMGCSGICTGTHVHFYLKYNGRDQNPGSYIAI